MGDLSIQTGCLTSPNVAPKSHGLDIIIRHVQKDNASLFNVLHGKFMEIHPEDPSLRCLRDI